jgi:hypothetical protein
MRLIPVGRSWWYDVFAKAAAGEGSEDVRDTSAVLKRRKG